MKVNTNYDPNHFGQEGTVGPYHYHAKVFDIGSEYGINGGRISKLFMRHAATGEEVICYDRGWGMDPPEPGQTELMEAFNAILAHYPDPKAEQIEQWRCEGLIVDPVERDRKIVEEMRAARKANDGLPKRISAFLRRSFALGFGD